MTLAVPQYQEERVVSSSIGFRSEVAMKSWDRLPAFQFLRRIRQARSLSHEKIKASPRGACTSCSALSKEISLFEAFQCACVRGLKADIRSFVTVCSSLFSECHRRVSGFRSCSRRVSVGRGSMLGLAAWVGSDWTIAVGCRRWVWRRCS